MNQINQPLKFSATFFDLDGAVDTSSAITVSIENPEGDVIYTGTVLPTGSRYIYELDDALVDQYGIYTAFFSTDDPDVVPQVADDWELVSALADMLDAAVGSRLAAASYVVPPTTAAIRTELDANSTKLDVAISTRLATAGYTAPPTAAQVRAELDANSTKLDVTIGSRLAAADYTQPLSDVDTIIAVTDGLESRGYTADRAVALDNLDVPISGLPVPLTSPETIAAVQSGLTGQGYTTTRAGYLDTLNGLIANLWSAATRTLTDYDQEAIIESLDIIQGVINVLNGLLTAGELTVHAPLIIGRQEITMVQGDDYRYADGRYFEWQFTDTQCPDLTGGSTALKIKNLRTGTVVLTKAGTIPAARTVRFELTSTDTAAITADAYAFEVSAVLANTHVVTLIPLFEGKAYIKAQA